MFIDKRSVEEVVFYTYTGYLYPFLVTIYVCRRIALSLNDNDINGTAHVEVYKNKY